MATTRHTRLVLAALAGLLSWAAPAHAAAPPHAPAYAPAYAPHRLVVGYDAPVASAARYVGDATGTALKAAGPADPGAGEQVLSLPSNLPVVVAARRFRQLAGIAYAVPDYLAHAAGAFIPNDPGPPTRTSRAGGWQRTQWNFLAADGVDAPAAWANLRARHRPGASGVVIAVLDTGVAFRDWGTFQASPDFAGTTFVAPCDLIAGAIVGGACDDPYPLDRQGHGTFVAGLIAETTNNHLGLTGLAYGASVMPVRVLDARGNGDSATIARGIRYAVQHHAQVVNLSLAYTPDVTADDVPEVVSAIRYAHDHGVVVVAAAGNDYGHRIDYPAAAPGAIPVGATTRDRCRADYSNAATGLDLVAPGGGDDATIAADPDCHPARNLPDVFQMTFGNPNKPNEFGYPGGWYGTSMACPDVAAAAAMVIASGVIGRHPTPDAILARLEETATPLGGATVPSPDYGYGLLNLGAATSPTAGTTARRR